MGIPTYLICSRLPTLRLPLAVGQDATTRSAPRQRQPYGLPADAKGLQKQSAGTQLWTHRHERKRCIAMSLLSVSMDVFHGILGGLSPRGRPSFQP